MFRPESPRRKALPNKSSAKPPTRTKVAGTWLRAAPQVWYSAAALKEWIIIAGTFLVAGCSGAGESADKNRVFYDWQVATGEGATGFEQLYPPLDLIPDPPLPQYMGVTVLRGGVHLSRPKDWMMRDADNTPGQAHVQYISPNAYSFALYERPDAPTDPWRDIMNRYEDDVQSLGAKVVGKRVPLAVFIGQGRAYTIQRTVEAPKRPLVSGSREILLRSDNRVILVQIVFEGENLEPVDDELLRVINTMEVL